MNHQDHQESSPPKNPILDAALRMIEAVTPGGMNDPEAALRATIPTLRHIIIRRIEKPTMDQLRALQERQEFHGQNLVQIKKAVEAGDVRLGKPAPEPLAQIALEALALAHIQAELVPLSEEEIAKELGFFDDPPPYFRNSP